MTLKMWLPLFVLLLGDVWSLDHYRERKHHNKHRTSQHNAAVSTNPYSGDNLNTGSRNDLTDKNSVPDDKVEEDLCVAKFICVVCAAPSKFGFLERSLSEVVIKAPPKVYPTYREATRLGFVERSSKLCSLRFHECDLDEESVDYYTLISICYLDSQCEKEIFYWLKPVNKTKLNHNY